MQQKTPLNDNFSLISYPKANWARCVIVILALYCIWDYVHSDYTMIWLKVLGLFSFMAIINTLEYQQEKILALQQHIEELQQGLPTTFDNKSINPIVTSNSLIDHPSSTSSITIGSTTHDVFTDKPAGHQDLKVMTSLWSAALNWFKGGNSIVRIAVVILLIGVIFLLRFASEYWQLTLSAKMAAIAVAGVVLTGIGYVLRQKRFEYAISLQGLGLGVIFLVLFSSYYLQVIVSLASSYVMLMLLLAITLWLALRQNALILAFIALGSGFIAPFILNNGSDNVSILMGYYFMLNIALAIIVYFKPWRILNTLALFMTFGIGGFAIWFNADPLEYFQISCWVWAIFLLYLYISILYSRHIVALGTQFKDIPLVDTALIFATPFMAFSLYAGLVNSSAVKLSLASVILALVYLTLGYFIHKRSSRLTLLSQCFYGLGLVFAALILPFAFNAYWTSVGWAIHGLAVLWIGRKYQIDSARYFGVVVLLASGLATLYSHLLSQNTVLFASSVLMMAYAWAWYIHQSINHESASSVSQFQRIIGNLFLLLSFLIAPYVYKHLLLQASIDQSSNSLSLLLWFNALTLIWWYKDHKFYPAWWRVNLMILFVTLVTTAFELSWINYPFTGVEKIQWTLICLLWLSAFYLFNQYKPLNKFSNIYIQQILSTLAMVYLAILGAVFASLQSLSYVVAILPIVCLIFSYTIQKLQFWKNLWIANPGVSLLTVGWLWMISISHSGAWLWSYVPLFNPVDLLSIAAYMILVLNLQSYLFSHVKFSQIISTLILLISGLLMISSILLRVLHHYVDLPYWSWQIWQNGTVQAWFTIVWTIVALILTLLASRQAWRYVWMMGIAVLAVVIFKLIFLDLSHSHTITRIISFIGSGLIMLVIGYFAPLPPVEKTSDLK